MKAKRIISLLLVVAMSFGVFAGCGKKADETKTTVEGLPEGKVTLQVGVRSKASVTSYDDNAFTNYLEEMANVEIEFVYYSSTKSEYKQQLALSCSSGEELPDMILGFDLDSYTVNQYGEDGYFIDLTDYIDAYAPNYKAQLENLEDETKEIVQEKGKHLETGEIFAMPNVKCMAIDNLQSIMYINQTWLNNLGLQVPTTTEELRTVLHAFKTQDPNKNGVADEIPMIGKANIMNYLINAFVYYDAGNFNITDGKVWDPVVTDEYREALIYANQLVKDGLYSDLSFSIADSSEYKTLISPADGPSKVGIFVGHHEQMTNSETDALNHFTALPALKDATGMGGYTVYSKPSVLWAGYITKDCEYPAAAMKLMDVFYMDETVTRQRHGEKDVDWVYQEGKNAYGTDSYTKVLNTDAFFNGSQTWGYNMIGIETHENYLLIEESGEGRAAQAARLQKEQWSVLENGKKPEETDEYLIYTEEEYEVREEKAATVANFIATEMTYFIAGEKDPSDDSAWNEYLMTLKSIGREELVDICQSAYDRK